MMHTTQTPQTLGIDVSEDLMTLAPAISPSLSRYLKTNKFSTQTKHEWFDDVILPKTFTVTGVSGSDVSFAGGVAPAVNYILNFTNAAGIHLNAVVKVTSLVDADTATVSVVSGAVSNITAGSTAHVVNEGIPEGRQFVDGGYHQGPREHNFTENFDEGFSMSRTLANVVGLASFNTEGTQAESAMKRLAQKMSKSIIFGSRFESGTIRGSGGLDYFIATQAGANLLAVSGNATAADFDAMILEIEKKCGETGDLAIVLHGAHAPMIRAFNSRTMGITDTSVGGAVNEYISAMGKVVSIVWDNQRPRNKIYFEDASRISYMALNGSQAQILENQPGRDGTYRPIIAEYTLEVRNAKEAHGCIVIN